MNVAAAFELTSEFADADGGSVGLPDGSLIDVGARLKSGDGVIVVNKQQEVDALRGCFFLKEVEVPAGQGDVPLSRLNRDQLVAHAETLGLAVADDATKADIKALIESNDEGGNA